MLIKYGKLVNAGFPDIYLIHTKQGAENDKHTFQQPNSSRYGCGL